MTEAPPDLAADVLMLTRQLSQQPDAAHAGRLLAAEIRERIAADQVCCVMQDGAQHMSVDSAGAETIGKDRTLSVIDRVLVTRECLRVDVLGFDGSPIAVVAASRAGEKGPFSKHDAAVMHLFAAAAGPALAALLILESRSDSADGDTADGPGPYLRASWEHHQTEGDQLGTFVLLLPRWARAGHWLIASFAIMAATYSITAQVDQTIEGPGIIKAVQRISLIAPAAGVVRTIEVVAGQRVEPGELVASIYNAAGQSVIDRFNGDIRAAVGGIVSDIRLRVGQRVLGGDIVGGVTRPEAGFEVISFVPGAHAPLLSRGMPLTVRLANYPETEARLRVDHIGLDLVGPSDALKFAGPEGSSLAISGPVVIIRSTVTAQTFESDGRTYRYHDGLAATSRLRVGSEPLLFNLFPGLRAQNP